jgi:hypothetical protein
MKTDADGNQQAKFDATQDLTQQAPGAQYRKQS